MQTQYEKMRWYLFWVFTCLFVTVSILTILALFFGFGNLSEEYEGRLVTAFVIEVGVAIIALFYSLFGLKPSQRSKKPVNIPAKVQEDVGVVMDAPVDDDLQMDLSQPVYIDDLDPLEPYTRAVEKVDDFQKLFTPYMVQYLGRGEHTGFIPNLNVVISDNPLLDQDITLAAYVEQNVGVQQETFPFIKGTREIRAGFDAAVQWFSCEIPVPGIHGKPDTVMKYQQFQKYIVSADKMSILTISYPTEGGDPEHVRCLLEILKNFGVAKQIK